MERIAIAVIGGGVVGCAAALELTGKHDGVFLFEKNPGITQGENQSSRNSGVIHSGIYYDATTRPLKAALCVEGNRLLYAFCEAHRVPALPTGKLVVAVTEDEEEVLDLYLARARENGVPGVERIPGQRVREKEPNVTAVSALWVPSAGVVDPVSLVYRLHTLAERQGAHFVTGTEVVGLSPLEDGVEIRFRYPDGREERALAAMVINAAGVDADRVARLLDPASPFELDPVRGESYAFYSHRRPELAVGGRNIYPTPEVVETPHGRHFTVGVHLTPTFEDLTYPPALGTTVTVGPRLVPAPDRDAWQGTPAPPEAFAERARAYFPGLRTEDLVWHQAGLQARLKGYPDFVIHRDSGLPNVVHLLGIDSPGLTAALALARRISLEIVTDQPVPAPSCGRRHPQRQDLPSFFRQER